jgi:hypothetical protein
MYVSKIKYKIEKNIMKLEQYTVFDGNGEKIHDEDREYSFNYQCIKYENGLIFMKEIEKNP